MINNTSILSCFRNLIGFDQTTSTDYPQLASILLTSESGQYVQRIHPLLTTENIFNCSPVDATTLSSYLYQKRDSSIINLVNNIYTTKQLNESGKELITDVKMYEGSGNFNDKIVKQGRFVGYKVIIMQSDLSVVFRQIGLQLDALNPALDIYVYHSSKTEHVAKLTIDANKVISFSWYDVTKQILSEITGGYYIIGYYEADLIGQAIKREQYLTRQPKCASCNATNYNLYNKWSKFIQVAPIYVNSNNLNDDKTKWDGENEIILDGINWGINVSYSAICDVSSLFCRNRDIFNHVLGLQIAHDLLEDMVYTSKDNQIKTKNFQLAVNALGDGQSTGIKLQLTQAIKALSFNTSGINNLCLPCDNNNQKLKWGTVY